MFRSFMKGLVAAVPVNVPAVHIVVVYFAEDNAADESNRAAVEQLLEYYQHSNGFAFTYDCEFYIFMYIYIYWVFFCVWGVLLCLLLLLLLLLFLLLICVCVLICGHS